MNLFGFTTRECEVSLSWSGAFIFIFSVLILKITIADPYLANQRQAPLERSPASTPIQSTIIIDKTP